MRKAPAQAARAASGVVVAVAIGLAVLVGQPWSGGAGASPADDQLRAAAQATARAEAQRLLGLVTPPPGAKQAPSSPSTHLAGPAVGTPMSDSLIVETRYWRVPLPADQALAWFAAHPPRGLSAGGEGGRQVLDGAVVFAGGYSYEAPSSQAWTGAQAQVGVAPIDEATSAVRADGMTLWLDPIPVPDQAPGPRMRVSAAGGCPAEDRGIVGVSNPPPALAGALLPPGAPTGGLRCDYRGSQPADGQPFQLSSATALDAAAAAALAAKASALSLSHTNGDITSCLGMDGLASALALFYPDGREIDLWVSVPCTGYVVSNGAILATGNPLADA
jgi:hypothetical protein